MTRLLAAGLCVVLFSLIARVPAQDKDKDKGKKPEKPPVPIAFEYFPLSVGNQWTYKGTYKAGGAKEPVGGAKEPVGGAKEPVVVRVEKQVTLEAPPGEKSDTPEKVAGFQLGTSTGDRTGTEQVAVMRDGVFRFMQNGKPIRPPLCFFKLPLVAGKSWTAEWKSDDGKVNRREFTAGPEQPRMTMTINGERENLEVVLITSKDAVEDSSITYWFARGYGMVKQEVKIGKNETTLELTKFKKGG
jgi:hypothetical protein